jgi:hypothetical protein
VVYRAVIVGSTGGFNVLERHDRDFQIALQRFSGFDTEFHSMEKEREPGAYLQRSGNE